MGQPALPHSSRQEVGDDSPHHEGGKSRKRFWWDWDDNGCKGENRWVHEGERDSKREIDAGWDYNGREGENRWVPEGEKNYGYIPAAPAFRSSINIPQEMGQSALPHSSGQEVNDSAHHEGGKSSRVAEPKQFFLLRLRLSKSFGSGSRSGSDLSFEGACFHIF